MMRDTTEIVQQSREQARGVWTSELRSLLSVGIPMGLTQLMQFSINTVDVLMIGRVGPEALAASSLGLVMFYAAWLMGFGPTMAVTPMVSQSLGADRNAHDDVRRSVRMALWAIVIGSPFLMGAFLFAEQFALLLGQPADAAHAAGPYVLALAPGLPFALGVMTLRNYLAAIDRMRVPLAIIVMTTLLNALFNYALIYGNFGFPRMELVGAGIASSLAHAIGFFALVAYVTIEKESARFEIFKDVLTPDWARLREVIALGVPIGVAIAFEALLFNASLFLMGRIGINEMAAYQVALNVAALGFMLPLGLSMGGAVRVGLAAGAGDWPRVRRASALTFGVCVAAILMTTAPIVVAPAFIAGLYLDASSAENMAVIKLVIGFLPIVAGFALFDATQVAANQCLRGLKDVRMPMVLTGISYWIIGFPTATWLGLYTPIGANGVWWGLLVSLGAASILLGGRLWMLLRTPPATDSATVSSA